MKSIHLQLTLLAVGALLAASPARADLVTSNLVVDAQVRAGNLAAVASSTITATNGGIIEIKSGSIFGDGTRKGYFQFNVGSIPNTNANASFYFPLNASPKSAIQRVTLWGLNQAYPGLSAATTWNSAQANMLNGNDLLTDPTNTFTATAISSVIISNYSNPSFMSYTFTLPGGPNGWGGYVKNSGGSNLLTLALSGIYDSAYSGGASVRLPLNSATLTFNTAIGAGPLPSISPLTNVVAYQTLVSPMNYFTTIPASPATGPTAASDNQAVVADGDIHITNTGGGWSIYVVAGNTKGTANITLAIADSLGNPANASFQVTVRAIAPIISNPPDTNTLVNGSVTIPFTVYEPYSNANNITIWATSLNSNVVADSGLTVNKTDGGGTNRAVIITTRPGTNGIAPIALWASDGVNSNRTAFALLVLPAANVVFFDSFDYTPNLSSGGSVTISNDTGRLDLASGSFWKVRKGTDPSIKIQTNQAVVTFTSTANTPQSLIGALVNGPFQTNQGVVLYTAFRATWTDVPQAPGSTLLHLYNELQAANGTVGLIARVSTTVSNSPAGQFRVAVANGDNTSSTNMPVEFPLDLSPNTTHLIVTRYEVDSATTTLWVDPVNEASPSVAAQDSERAQPIYDVGLRQSTDTGPVLIDNLKVSLPTTPVVTLTAATVAGGSVQLDFTAPSYYGTNDFAICTAVNVTDAYNPASPAATITGGSGAYHATLPVSGAQHFYRVKVLHLRLGSFQ